MSSNLVKWCYTNIQEEDTRVIDVNSLMVKRIEELGGPAEQPEFEDGFMEGLQTVRVDAPGDGETASGNIIKAREDARILMEQASGQAEEILAKAHEEAEEIRGGAVRLAEAECGSIREQAKEQGYKDGMKKAMLEAERMKAELEARQMELEAEYQKQVERLEPDFVETITGIYEHIFHVELEGCHDILVYLIGDAMRKTEGSRNFLIHVSREDYPYVSMQKKQLALSVASASITVEITEDVTLGKNECLIETDGGILDCGVGTQLAELRQKLRLLSYEK